MRLPLQRRPRLRRAALAALLLASGALPLPAAAQAVHPLRGGDAAAGKDKAEAERCTECHGPAGQGVATTPETLFARLAGQHPAYIVKQVQDFRSGARKHDMMAIVARHLEDEDLADIAAHYAAQPPMRGEGAAAPPGEGGPARRLYEQGDPARGIAACSGCHGPRGEGGAAAASGGRALLVPAIGGQAPRYIERQLNDWRLGFRRNSPEGVMTAVARSLGETEVQALADYVSGLR
jgi:cytochrome c553